MKTGRRESGPEALDLIEEAIHLLRTAPAATLAVYYLGAIPFVLAFLYFWAEMSRSPFADQYLAETALATAALFIWMKFCQTLFARRIRAQLATEHLPRWSFRQCLHVLFQQAIVQPSGLFIIPMAMLFLVPFGWVYAFYQNVTVLADPDSAEASDLVKRGWKQASIRTGQNHIMLAILLMFGLCVLLNWAVILFAAPSLFKTLFGIESVFIQAPRAMLNTTFFTGILAATYLCVDPMIKTIYALRCFYGESMQSGEDLKADLKRFADLPRDIAVLPLIVISLAGVVLPAAAQSSSAAISPADLDRQIVEVIHGRKYVWRMPRVRSAESNSEAGFLTRFLEDIGRMIRNALRAIEDWIGAWLQRWFSSSRTNRETSGFGWASSSLLLFVLLAAVLSGLAIFLLRVWNRRKQASGPITAQALPPPLDITDETIGADRLPEDAWTKLARELLERGQFRLSLRAFYLASLAHLAERNLIGIARFKSNRDYENELRRRGHAIPNLLSVFTENVSIFECIWYGMHEIDQALVLQFAANVDRIRAAA